MNLSDMKAEVKMMVELYIDAYNSKTDDYFLPPPVGFTLKGSSAGRHSYYINDKTSGRLSFNAVLMQENFEDFLYQTVGHEVAHHIVFVKYGHIVSRTGRVERHGRHWQHIMRTLGLNPDRTHNYCTASVRKTFEYKCSCKSWEFTKIRHNKSVSKNHKWYTCPKCKSAIKPA